MNRELKMRKLRVAEHSSQGNFMTNSDKMKGGVEKAIASV